MEGHIAGQPFLTFIKNSAIIVGLSTIGAVMSSAVIAYGFARIPFKGKKFWFTCMMGTLMLPHEVLMIPQYIMFAKLDWLNSFKPIVVPQFFGHAFFIFLMIQFIRTIPEELIQPLLYLNKPELYPVSLALKLFLDTESASNWGAMFAMSAVSLLPVILVFFLFQKYIVQGISTTGLK
ncbi:carbohydrate ABC transporter permease [Kribbella sp. NPDC055071]